MAKSAVTTTEAWLLVQGAITTPGKVMDGSVLYRRNQSQYTLQTGTLIFMRGHREDSSFGKEVKSGYLTLTLTKMAASRGSEGL